MIEVLKQALEALEKNYKLINGEGTRFGLEGAMDGYYSGCFDVDGTNKETENAIASLRQAIAELESQEPVATVTSETGADITMSWWHEPALPVGTKLFTHPPQRTWVGLTDDEIDTWNIVGHESLREFVRAIEAKLKEKNT